jgi:hypothetical protein
MTPKIEQKQALERTGAKIPRTVTLTTFVPLKMGNAFHPPENLPGGGYREVLGTGRPMSKTC